MNEETRRQQRAEFEQIITEHPEIVPDLLQRIKQYIRDREEKEDAEP